MVETGQIQEKDFSLDWVSAQSEYQEILTCGGSSTGRREVAILGTSGSTQVNSAIYKPQNQA